MRISLLSLVVAMGIGVAAIDPLEAAGLPKPQPNRKPVAAAGDGNQSRGSSVQPHAAKPPGSKTSGLAPGRSDKKAAEVHARKSGRHKRPATNARAQAAIRPNPTLSYHGLLHQPQRYDPSRRYRSSGGAPNPQAGDVLHDHFQELDKNRDGVIDPFERAFSRLDIDRDLANHRWR